MKISPNPRRSSLPAFLAGCFLHAVFGLSAATPIQIAQQAFLKSATPMESDRFGYSVAISGDTVVIGAPDANDQGGSAFVFVRNGTVWTQQTNLAGRALFQQFGYSVALSGETLVVGAPSDSSPATGVNGNQNGCCASGSGAAYVFVRTGNTWTQQAYLKASNTGDNDQFGWSVALSGNTVIVGAKNEDSTATGVNSNQVNNGASDAGAAYVFVRTGTTWSQQAYLKASNTGGGDHFGYAVGLSDDTAVVSAPDESSSFAGVQNIPFSTTEQLNNSAAFSGAAYIFVRAGTNWTQQAYLKASNTGAGDQFGISASISGDTVVLGAWSEDSAGGINSDGSDNDASGSGAAYVFIRNGSSWSQQAFLKASNLDRNDAPGDFFGGAVSVWNDTIIVGASREDSSSPGINGNGTNNNFPSAGAAYVFVRAGTPPAWSEQAYLKASNPHTADFFGWSVAVSSNTLVAGAYAQPTGALESGAAYVFTNSSATAGSPAGFPEYIITTYAGTGEHGFSGDGGPATNAQLNLAPDSTSGELAVDKLGNLFIADIANSRVRRVGTNSIITTIAGTGELGFNGDGGGASDAELYYPSSVAVDQGGALFIADTGNNRVRRVSTNNLISTFVGNGAVGAGSAGDNGPALQAQTTPINIAMDRAGQLFIVEDSERVRRVNLDSNIVHFAGNGSLAGDDVPATQARLGQPRGTAADGVGAVYFADASDHTVRRVSTNGIITTIAGLHNNRGFSGDGGPATSARLDNPVSVAVDRAGRIYIADRGNGRIRLVDTNGIISTVGGTGSSFGRHLGEGGPARDADLFVNALAVDDAGNIFVAGLSIVRVLKPTGRMIPFAQAYSSNPAYGNEIDFGRVLRTNVYSREITIGNAGNIPLLITSLELISIGGSQPQVILQTKDPVFALYRPATLPYEIPAGYAKLNLTVTVQWRPEDIAEMDSTLRIFSSDPAIPAASYHIVGSAVGTEEEVVEKFIGSFIKIAGAKAGRKELVLDGPQTATFALDSGTPYTLTAEIPFFLGGGSVQISNFTGSMTATLLPIPNDAEHAAIRIESGQFTAPSIRLPSGLETGINQLTFGRPEQSGGTLVLSNGAYTAFATATIVNDLIPQGLPVVGNYSGIYNPVTGGLSSESQSTDLLLKSDRLLFSRSTNGFWLSWIGSAALEQSTQITGPWATVTNVLSPYHVSTTNAPGPSQRFFRLRF